MARLKSKKKSAGRRKIEMKFIEQENARTVTFSKRRAGLFKKATELSILCGAQVAVIIFSLCGRAYTFGHPTVENVLARFFNRSPMPNLQDSVHGRRIHAATIQQLKEQVEEARKELDKKKRRRKELELALENSPCQTSDESLSRMSLDQLKEIKERMVKLREDIVCRIDAAKSKSDADAIKAEEKVAFDLANVEGDGDGGSSIPSDWLKL